VSFEALQNEVRSLGAEERRKLMALLVALEDSQRPGYAAELARRVDDQTPGRWLSAEQCAHELGLPPEGQ
jgi:hypothetical protein